MTTPCSGQIGLLDLRTELGASGQIALNDTNVRTLCGKSSGQIALSDCYCKSHIHWVNITNPESAGAWNDNNAVYGSDAFHTSGSETSIKTYDRWQDFFAADYSGHYAYYDNNYSNYISPSNHNLTRVLMIHGRRFTATGNFKVKRVRVKSYHNLRNASSNSQIAMSMYIRYKVAYSNHDNPGIDMGIVWQFNESITHYGNCVAHNHPVESIIKAGALQGAGTTRSFTADDYITLTDQTIMTAGQSRWVFVAIAYDAAPWSFIRFNGLSREYEIDMEVEGGYAI